MKEANSQKQSDSMRSRVRTSILLLLLALVAVTATTVAWFSIADKARVRTMSLDIISGVDLRMDLDAHDTIEAYKKNAVIWRNSIAHSGGKGLFNEGNTARTCYDD